MGEIDQDRLALDFRQMYDAYFEFVWRSLRSHGVYPSDTMDLAQKVFLAAHVGLPKFEGRSQLRTWLFGICRRMASDYRRSARIRHEIVTDATAMDLHHAEYEGSAGGMESRQKAAIADAILQRLPEPQRVVFVLFEIEEMSGDEIAQLLNISIGTVRSRMRLARERFRREVKRFVAKDPAERKVAVG